MVVNNIYRKSKFLSLLNKWTIALKDEDTGETILFPIKGNNLVNLMTKYNALQPNELRGKKVSRIYKNGNIRFIQKNRHPILFGQNNNSSFFRMCFFIECRFFKTKKAKLSHDNLTTNVAGKKPHPISFRVQEPPNIHKNANSLNQNKPLTELRCSTKQRSTVDSYFSVKINLIMFNLNHKSNIIINIYTINFNTIANH